MIFIGLDLGTQGVRAIAVDGGGNVRAQGRAAYCSINTAQTEGFKEQLPQDWWSASVEALKQLAASLKADSLLDEAAAMAVDGTSGTITALDAAFNPIIPGIMYNDPRAQAQAARAQEAGEATARKLGYKLSASFALPRIMWIKENMPEVYGNTRVFSHQADYIVGMLTGRFGVSDYSNALKTGYDIVDMRWPDYIHGIVESDKLPDIFAPGARIGSVTKYAAELTGLPEGMAVAAGASDGTASAIASGAVSVGEFNTTIGSTLVIKGVTKNIITDPLGRVYCHRHPQGWYMPGGAGNVGGLCVNAFGQENFGRLNAAVAGLTPTGALCYPLMGRGERFPFVDKDAEGFAVNMPESTEGKYAAVLEGTAFVERLCYDTLAGLGCDVGGDVYIAGGAVKSPQWSQVRANVLGKRLIQPEVVEAAMGSAILAGTEAAGRTLTEAAGAMVRRKDVFEPDTGLTKRYDELYGEFRDECAKRGVI